MTRWRFAVLALAPAPFNPTLASRKDYDQDQEQEQEQERKVRHAGRQWLRYAAKLSCA